MRTSPRVLWRALRPSRGDLPCGLPGARLDGAVHVSALDGVCNGNNCCVYCGGWPSWDSIRFERRAVGVSGLRDRVTRRP